MSKHTPGPWILDAVDSAYAYIHGDNLIDGKGGHLARVLLTGNDFSTANARLIAAAPELLEALQRIFAEGADFEAVAMQAEEEGLHNSAAKVRAAAAFGRAAIAKATGGAA